MILILLIMSRPGKPKIDGDDPVRRHGIPASPPEARRDGYRARVADDLDTGIIEFVAVKAAAGGARSTGAGHDGDRDDGGEWPGNGDSAYRTRQLKLRRVSRNHAWLNAGPQR